MTVGTLEVTRPREWTAWDRCDGCGAQAYWLATHEQLGEFLFCNHHHRKHEDALATMGFAFEESPGQIEGSKSLFDGSMAT